MTVQHVSPGERANPAGDVFDALRIPAWYADALCAQVDSEIFFVDKGGSPREAKLVCNRCPVRDLCLQAAMDSEEDFGIWGGKTVKERLKMRRSGNFQRLCKMCEQAFKPGHGQVYCPEGCVKEARRLNLRAYERRRPPRKDAA